MTKQLLLDSLLKEVRKVASVNPFIPEMLSKTIQRTIPYEHEKVDENSNKEELQKYIL